MITGKPSNEIRMNGNLKQTQYANQIVRQKGGESHG